MEPIDGSAELLASSTAIADSTKISYGTILLEVESGLEGSMIETEDGGATLQAILNGAGMVQKTSYGSASVEAEAAVRASMIEEETEGAILEASSSITLNLQKNSYGSATFQAVSGSLEAKLTIPIVYGSTLLPFESLGLARLSKVHPGQAVLQANSNMQGRLIRPQVSGTSLLQAESRATGHVIRTLYSGATFRLNSTLRAPLEGNVIGRVTLIAQSGIQVRENVIRSSGAILRAESKTQARSETSKYGFVLLKASSKARASFPEAQVTLKADTFATARLVQPNEVHGKATLKAVNTARVALIVGDGIWRGGAVIRHHSQAIGRMILGDGIVLGSAKLVNESQALHQIRGVVARWKARPDGKVDFWVLRKIIIVDDLRFDDDFNLDIGESENVEATPDGLQLKML